MATYTAGCSKVGSFSYAQYFTLYVILNERNIDSASNTSIVDYNVYCQSSGSGSINAKHFLYFNLGGNVFRNETVQVNVSSPNAYIGIASGSLTVTHDSNGNYTLGVSAQIAASSYGVSASINDSFVCATIPRYTTVYNSARGRTIDSISVNWSTTDARDWTQYSLNGGAWTNANDTVAADNKSGYYTISGLSPNTSYTVKTRCRRADSGLWSEAGAITIGTYHYGLVTKASNFNDEQNPTINYSNAFGNGVAKLEACISVTGAADDVKYREISKTGTSYTFNLTEDERNVLRKKAVGNTLAVAFFIRTTYNGKTYHSSWGVIMSIINANPTFTNWSYEDTNSAIINLTGNNQIVVKGYSSVKGIVTQANKAIAKKQATMSKYQLNIGGGIKEKAYSSSGTVQTDPIIVNTNTFTMYAIDSRTNSTSVKKTLSSSNYKEYFNISIDTSKTKATRKDKVGSETTLNVEGKIWNANFGKVQNSINTFTVEYKLTSQTDEDYKLLNVSKPTLSGNTFKLNTLIPGDLDADGFTVTDAFNIRVKITDALSPSTYVITLGSGKPNLAVHKDGVAINKPYDVDEGGALQVNGQIVGQNGGGWWQARDRAIIKNISHGQQAGYSFNPLGSIQTSSGSWEIGNLSGNESLYFSYVADNDYNTGNNANKQITLPNNTGSIPVGVVLYDNASGTTGTVTLSENSANFGYLEIYFKWRDRHGSVKLNSPNGKSFSLINAITWTTGEVTQYENQSCSISGTSITRGARTFFNVEVGGVIYQGANSSDYFYITKVVGYR